MRTHLCSKCGIRVPSSGGYCRICANEYMRIARSIGKFNQPKGPYEMVRVGKKTIRKHRIVLGLTDPKIYGHHKDGNGLNNAPENLEAMTPAEHYFIHHGKGNL